MSTTVPKNTVDAVLIALGFYLLVCLCCYSPSASAASECYSLAHNYYQQLYCDIEARGEGQALPAFHDFRRNTEIMQALLLKPHARRLGIELTMPTPAAPRTQSQASTAPRTVSATTVPATKEACRREGDRVYCGSRRYDYVSNRRLEQLGQGALDPEGAMALPKPPASRMSGADLQRYLMVAYHHYLQKMMDIGLAESTLSYAKFAFLWHDLQQRGVDFHARFDTMYRYLKQDRRRLSVPIRQHLPASLSLNHCYPLQRLLICPAASRNWILQRS